MLPEKTKRKLHELWLAIWKHTAPDRFGHSHAFPERPMSSVERKYVLKVIKDSSLPCVLCSGPYGGLYMQVFDHSDVAEIKPECVFQVDHEHFQNLRNVPWDKQFEYFAKMTHSEENARICAFYKLPEPKNMGHYQY